MPTIDTLTQECLIDSEGSLEISGVIQSTGATTATNSVNKAGPGDLRLSGNNSYLGITNVEQGTLTAGNSANTSQVQWLQFPTGTTAGSFTLTMSVAGQAITIGPLAYTGTAATDQGGLQTALNTTFGSGQYTVTIPGTNFVSTDTEELLITASGGLASATLPLFTVTGTGLTATPAVNPTARASATWRSGSS